MNSNRLYEDKDGIQYQVIGFENNKYKMEVVNSPYPNISEGIIEMKDELPQPVDNSEVNEPLYNPNKL